MDNKKVLTLLKKIPRGKITTYKMLAQVSGVKNPRLVGQILHGNIDPQAFPCHRVIRSDGNIAHGYAFGGKNAQIQKLRKEGVLFIGNKVDLSKSLCILTE
ncbi:hypothetical protein A3H80_02600 [Candidatus Roizmanbacteria bacterium RIFCSPLOWO2_02_FULL_37_19]|uniref:Methylated-DNA-[protein]-cysteine S-methyltransferase DNA binding domain-containing protein n=1 Tax=Candidatus Roizmanbacteria bacterium RIFCSPHIGHO2_02_FULL_37_24 TaxID=1802037 RepID=A0A1F7H187_9BACT|nr:MAG: hypothetical protein A2862_02305 [Candidatus Roizmanbacteria bacterium RIFCSPHIGHO2_01_FULL_38_41]OGK24813.1 MAG: hypothetical protein A3C24_00755 [Candidatus Roizmanbacteria bacterium RIFCSPHIGHO2_02_FULL_37_24]OGK32789.1 MAG: hypothetical protein A3E10_03280 [Candidatus Roizmanbacteria bacterium RIFCSPHIGHO2_12_FULL_37_23]OGK45585.1 MAG: hypothetical protein A2956_02750 [Candidatus Roizmanbacteria bacterium RIFCSPLOWO2_01_FULL_37_57]OGK53629.1 MAG: hypothetical protein A3H80_02600 [Ca